MKKLLAFCALLILAFVPNGQTQSASANCTASNGFVAVPFAHETVTVSTVSIGLTAATYAPTSCTAQGSCAVMAFMTTATDNLRFWDDGTAPTSTVGHFVGATSTTSGGPIQICQASLPLFKAIRAGAADVPLSVTYFRPPQ